ncbi:hypothetical protein CgunFtcFv8_006874 [Champsocephalus gunnari]|uniref:Uncharacterized protein n=1 Tax=Champsocephalus gunnari TaxID=52237 RepID=A0AAN8CGE2_CHAGU|nr:hypothetical protein CgunFtcFv8_006874 [Champsocephalus gunnari]
MNAQKSPSSGAGGPPGGVHPGDHGLHCTYGGPSGTCPVGLRQPSALSCSYMSSDDVSRNTGVHPTLQYYTSLRTHRNVNHVRTPSLLSTHSTCFWIRASRG